MVQLVRRVGGLFFVIMAVVIVQRFAPGTAIPERSVALALGFALIAASLLGHLTELLRLPRLSGYLLFGLLCGPYLLNLITSLFLLFSCYSCFLLLSQLAQFLLCIHVEPLFIRFRSKALKFRQKQN